MIQALYVRNFRNLTDLRVKLDQLTVILGNNGAGKSSLAGAVQYALAGHCPWTDAAGKGFKDLIQHGQAQATIDLDTDIGVIMRSLTGTGASLSIGERTGKDAEAVLAGKLPPREILNCMLSSDGFIDLPVKQQQDILFRLSGGEVNAEWVAGKLSTEERDALGDALATRLQGSGLMEHLYKTAYGMRTEANKRVKELAARTQTDDQPCAYTEQDENRLALELAKARRALAERQQQAGAAQAQIRAHEAAKRRWEMAQETFKAAQTALAAHGKRPDAPTDEELEALRSAMQDAEAALAAAEAAHYDATAPLIAAKTRLEQLQGLTGTCVLAADIPCPMTQENITALQQAASAAVAEAQKAEQTAADAMQAARTACNTAADAFSQAQTARTVAEQWDAKAEFLAEKLAAAQAALGTANADYQANPAPDPSAIAGNLEAAQKRVDQAEAELASVQESMSADSKRKQNIAELETAKARAKLLDGLVKQLEPGGLPAQAMAETVGNVLGQVNDALGSFTGFALKIEGEELTVTRGGVDTAVRLLSESEQLRVGAAISVAFAKLTGFGFVIVDAADRLDPDSRGPLVGMLMRSGVQALVLAVPLNGKRPAGNGVVCYELIDGQAVLVEQKQEVAA